MVETKGMDSSFFVSLKSNSIIAKRMVNLLYSLVSLHLAVLTSVTRPLLNCFYLAGVYPDLCEYVPVGS